VKTVFVAELNMVLELVGNTYIVCLMNQVFGEVAKLFLEIMCVNIGGIQSND
jgi:hypothetical protein